jgi:hypothetical protein
MTSMIHRSTTKIFCAFAIFASCCAFIGAIESQDAPTVAPQSLAGDWEYAMTPSLKMVLHLRVDGSGAISGTVDTPDSPPKHLELSNVTLKGNMLSYGMGPQPGPFREVITADGKKMAGAQTWVKVGATQAAPPLIPLERIAGDWVPPNNGAGAAMLRLHLDAAGALTGMFNTGGLLPQKVNLSKVEVSGRLLSYTLPDGNRFEGKLSDDGKTATATPASTVDATWQHVRTTAQTAAYDAAEHAKPTNGDWSGVISYVSNFPGVGPRNGTAKLTFHFQSNPDTCGLDVGLSAKENEKQGTVPCQMTLTGKTVHVDKVAGYHGSLSGTLSADGNHLSGTWTMGNDWHWTGPVQVDLQRAQ